MTILQLPFAQQAINPEVQGGRQPLHIASILIDSSVRSKGVPKNLIERLQAEQVLNRSDSGLVISDAGDDERLEAARLLNENASLRATNKRLQEQNKRLKWEEYKKELEEAALYSPVARFSRGRKEFIIKPEYLFRYWWIPDSSKPDDSELVDFKL